MKLLLIIDIFCILVLSLVETTPLLSSSFFLLLFSFQTNAGVVDANNVNKENANHDYDDDDYYLDQLLLKDEDSHRMRKLASLNKKMIFPKTQNNLFKRRNFPETNPHVCLAFLSCCGRTDLLNHTIAGVIRHMEQDEPNFLRYEIAWVDNGSIGFENSNNNNNDNDYSGSGSGGGGENNNNNGGLEYLQENYEIEHALLLNQNMGLAYGMNLLIFNLCQAPYILLLEEDWLYLDELVALQTPERKRSIATSIALIEHMERNNVTAFDGRTVMGAFLRHETYESFLTFPHADVWERASNVNIAKELPRSEGGGGVGGEEVEECDIEDDTFDLVADIDYRIFCSDPGIQRESIFGSYTNGAGLYKREHLKKIGRMYGEPGDAFHDRYVEGNYAYRAGLRNCHATVRLTDDVNCTSVFYDMCTGSFHHIGGGRGTRPRTPGGSKCEDQAWNFFGTPMYSKYFKFREMSGEKTEKCSVEELRELRERKFRDLDAKDYREEVRRTNQEVFERERAEREKVREQAKTVLDLITINPNGLREAVPWMVGKTDDEIREMAFNILRLVDSPHPVSIGGGVLPLGQLFIWLSALYCFCVCLCYCFRTARKASGVLH